MRTTAYFDDRRRVWAAALRVLLTGPLVVGCGRCNYESIEAGGFGPDGTFRDAFASDRSSRDGASESDGAHEAGEADGARDGQVGGRPEVLFIEGNLTPWGLGVDAAGNLYVGGSYRGTVDFGDGARSDGGSEDFFVASYTTDFALRWALTGQTTGLSNVRDISVRADGTIFAVGLLSGTTSNLGTPVDGGTQQDVLLFSLDHTGAPRWVEHWEGNQVNNHQGREIDMGRNGTLFVTGTYVDAIDFGAGPLPDGADSGFVVTFDDGPSARWSAPLLGFEAFPKGITAGAGGEVFVGGRFGSSIDFGDMRGPQTTAGSDDIFVAGFDDGGSLTWGATYGGAASDSLEDLTVDSGEPVLVGSSAGDADFGLGLDPGRGGMDAVLLRFDPATGAPTVARRYGDAGNERFLRVVAGSTLAAGGDFDGAFQLGTSDLMPVGGRDVFVVALSSEGDPIAVVQTGGAADEELWSLAWDASGSRWVVAIKVHPGDTDVFGVQAAGPGMAVAGFNL